jgi:undecaprenyl diphosphate synthase
MNYNRTWILDQRDRLNAKGVRIRFIGRRHERRLPRKLVALADETEILTQRNTRLHLTIALNYGGRAEVVDGVKQLAKLVEKGELDPEDVTAKDISAHLYAPEIPDPDLIIRTSGEKRISNFLLWQGAYAELLFTDTLWPDFRTQQLHDAILEYQQRVRRFGKAE